MVTSGEAAKEGGKGRQNHMRYEDAHHTRQVDELAEVVDGAWLILRRRKKLLPVLVQAAPATLKISSLLSYTPGT